MQFYLYNRGNSEYCKYYNEAIARPSYYIASSLQEEHQGIRDVPNYTYVGHHQTLDNKLFVLTMAKISNSTFSKYVKHIFLTGPLTN